MPRRMVLIASVAGACAGCGWMIPDDRDVPEGVRDQFEEMTSGIGPIPGQQDCEVLLDRIRKVATAPNPHAGGVGEYAWFIAPTDSGGQWEFVFLLDEDGNDAGAGGGGGGGCEPQAVREGDNLWWSGGSGSDAEVVHGGHAPEGTRSVRLTFGEHDPVDVPVDSDGYFLIVLNESACCEWSFPDLLEAIDADGNVIDSTNKPMG
jgi:hypothetical protein